MRTASKVNLRLLCACTHVEEIHIYTLTHTLKLNMGWGDKEL